MKKNRLYIPLLLNELKLYTEARAINDHNSCFKHLGRAHIISQLRWFHHFYVHFLMFEYAWRRKDYKEVRGQFLRLVVTIPGHFFKKLPTGNIGWSTIGLRETKPVPEDLKRLF
jgi:hypothetical protein